MRKRVVKPKFLRRIRVTCQSEAELRSIRARQNTSIFYCYLYEALFGGRIGRTFKGELEEISSGRYRNLHPDIVKPISDGRVFTEVKTVKTKNGKPYCSHDQFHNYTYDLLKDLNAKRPRSQVEYAFFRYWNTRLTKLCGKQIGGELAEETRDLLIVPLNLLILILLNSPTKKIDQTTNKGPDECKYWMIFGEILSQFHKDDNITDKLFSRSSERGYHGLKELLLLDNLVSERTQSPGNLYFWDQQIEPFQITRYYNRNPGQWAKVFKKRHEEILTGILGTKDLYKETEEARKEVPF